MAKVPALTADDITRLAAGADDEVLIEGEDAPPEGDDPGLTETAPLEEAAEPSAPPPPRSPLDTMVPLDRFNAVSTELTQVKGTLQQLVQHLASQSGSARPPTAPTYDDPSEPEDVRKWRKFVRDSVAPVLRDALAGVQQSSQQQILQTNELVDDQRVRADFPDYGEYEAEVNALRQQWFAATGNAAPRKYAYYVAKSERQNRAATEGRRNGVRRRAAPSAQIESVVPAKGRARATAGPLTPERINSMSTEEAFKYLRDHDIPI